MIISGHPPYQGLQLRPPSCDLQGPSFPAGLEHVSGDMFRVSHKVTPLL
ncbi:unnamed protein product [Musa hybrid cultivar]